MTLRLDDDLDLQIERLAAAQALSKQQLVVRAIREYLAREARLARTLTNAERIVRDNTGLLDRLGE